MKAKIVNILPWVLMLVAIVLLATFLGKDDDGFDYKSELKAKDDIIQSILKDREADRLAHEAVINEFKRKDSLLRVNYQTTIIKYEKIPVTVAGLSDTALRSAIENYR